MNGVNRPQAATAGGHIGADAGQQHNQRNLPHVGGLAAHVGPGDDLHAALAIHAGHAAVVGNEGTAAGFKQPGFDHRVAALRDVDAGLLDKHRGRPVERKRAFCQRAQCIQCGQGAGQAAQRRNELLQLVEQLFVEKLLPRQRPLLCRQCLVFKSLQLGRDVALGVFQSLAAAVVSGHLVELALRDFNIKTMYLVELHAQVGNAGAQLFAAFQVQQKRIAVGLNAAQLVQISIAAVVDDAAIANQRSGLVKHCALEQRSATLRRPQVFKNTKQKWPCGNIYGGQALCFL